MTAVTRAATALPPLATLLLCLLLPPGAMAVSCREALDAFERELNESPLAALAPDRYAELARAAEEASELRDEELCMKRVAELRAALAEAADAPPATSNRSAPAPPPAKAPPAAPLLLDAAPVDYSGDASAGGSRPEPEQEKRRLPD